MHPYFEDLQIRRHMDDLFFSDLRRLHALNAKIWENASNFQCDESVQEKYYSIKMGNKQTIFTDEQLDAYQVSPRVWY